MTFKPRFHEKIGRGLSEKKKRHEGKVGRRERKQKKEIVPNRKRRVPDESPHKRREGRRKDEQKREEDPATANGPRKGSRFCPVQTQRSGLHGLKKGGGEKVKPSKEKVATAERTSE